MGFNVLSTHFPKRDGVIEWLMATESFHFCMYVPVYVCDFAAPPLKVESVSLLPESELFL